MDLAQAYIPWERQWKTSCQLLLKRCHMLVAYVELFFLPIERKTVSPSELDAMPG